jgi:hypothetical protein
MTRSSLQQELFLRIPRQLRKVKTLCRPIVPHNMLATRKMGYSSVRGRLLADWFTRYRLIGCDGCWGVSHDGLHSQYLTCGSKNRSQVRMALLLFLHVVFYKTRGGLAEWDIPL